MKAVIMASGMGTRLKAVTGDKPKPMAELLGRPVMEYIIRLLKDSGFDDICAALRYGADEIMDYFGDGSAWGVRLQYRIEDEPLGTAGAVKNCEGFYGSEDFLVISGDAICDFDLRYLMEQHRAHNAAATLALYRNREPLRYGLAVTDSEGYIHGFVEKPDWKRVVTDLINTGIYILSPQVMDRVPSGRESDFAKDIFPALLHDNAALLGVAMDGYWCDIGTPASYYRCCLDALEGRMKLPIPDMFKPKEVTTTDEPAAEGESIDYCCAQRAELMGALSEALMDMGADYSDGLKLSYPNFTLHIAPLSAYSALRISVRSKDAEFARTLAISARDLVKALDEFDE